MSLRSSDDWGQYYPHECKEKKLLARAEKAEAKVRDLAAHIRRLEDELGHAPEGSGAV